MAFRLIWSPAAKYDLKDLASFVAEDSPPAANRFVRSIFQAIERLADFPESGRVVPEFDDPLLREVIRIPCRIVYRVDNSKRTIEIVRIWHTSRGTPVLHEDA